METEQQMDLAWGQRYLWLRHSMMPVDARHEYNIALRYKPPAGSTVENLTFAVRHLIDRHETLRTTYHTGTGNGPFQRIHPPRPFPVVHYEIEDHPGESPTAAMTAMTDTAFDLANCWPIRALVLTHRSVPTLLLMVVHHAALDDWSIKAFHHELEAVLAARSAGGPVELPAVRTGVADLARHEASAEGVQAAKQALAYWDRELSGLSAGMFRLRRTPDADEPEARGASLSSPVASAAARRLAARYQVWPSLIHTAAFAVLLAGYTQNTAAFFRTYAANRDSDEQGELMACLSQPVLVTIPLGQDSTFAQTVAAVAAGMRQAQEHSYGPYDEALELVAEHSHTRGVPLGIGVFYNYLSYAPATCGVRRTTLNRNAPRQAWAKQGDDLYFRVYEYRDGVVAVLSAQATVMDAADVERFLRGFETLLIEQADREDELTVREAAALVGFRDPSADAGPEAAEGDAERIARCLTEHPAVEIARVFEVPGADGGTELEAYVVADRSLTPALLRCWMLERMYDRSGVRCPHRFVLCASAPFDADSEWDWQSQPVVDTGDGRRVPGLPPVTEAEHALVDAVASANRLDPPSLAHSYVSAGGRSLNIPLVRDTLRRSGWTGAELNDLLTARPLRAVAAGLTPLAHTSLATDVG